MKLDNAFEAGQEFQEVELAGVGSGNSPFYIENSTKITSTIVLFLSFIVMHLFAAWSSPDLLSVKQEYFPFNKTEGNVTVDLDITLSALTNSHKFVDVNGSLIRNKTDSQPEIHLPIEYTSRTIFSKNNTVLNTANSEKVSQTLTFQSGQQSSSEFHVTHDDIVNFDTLEVKMSLTSNLTSIAGFAFNWSFANFSSAKYSRAARILMSFLIGYMLVIFTSYMNLETEAFTQIFCIIVGVAGVCSSNPIALILPAAKGARISDHVLMAAFLVAFRMFLLMQLELMRTRSSSPKLILTVIVSLAFAFYGTLNAAATYDRANHIMSSQSVSNLILPTEKILMEVHFVYAIVVFVWCILAYVQSKGYSNRRMWLFIFMNLFNLFTTIIAEVICPLTDYKRYSIFPSMTIAASHVTSAAFCIFFMHQGDDPDYGQIDAGLEASGSLDVEQMSENDLDDENDDGGLEEEEEEEEE
ncbi:hypothetical protein TRFO_16892 [Tritrichomonas foetus]|uniref:Transmembrane protein n=1 Tax=Tritrichomonas foetus TaxID=1144522 RepID=A0A1J4KPB1_9EUKA|nr:hypothetical protein TRFO_16892 [Tritrichomonas foetus]|eukprot:OHT13127.1 hypothetical protein TRFO_16892 [Tritrichomonas foetus]